MFPCCRLRWVAVFGLRAATKTAKLRDKMLKYSDVMVQAVVVVTLH